MDRTDEILQELRELRREHGETRIELREFRAAQKEVCQASAAMRAEHHRALFGNGKPGLVANMQDMQSRLTTLATTPATEAGGLSRKEAYAIGAAVLAGIEAIKAFLHIGP